MQHSSATARPYDPTSPTILLAEDHDDTRRVYCVLLRHFGYRVIEAVTGVEAVDIARRTKTDLILMDIGLPILDGWQAARMLKADPATSAVPLLAFSAMIDSTADLRGDTATFDGFIAKPVSPLQLVRRVAAYLELLGKRLPTSTPERTSAPIRAEQLGEPLH
jgi:two-component system cell cycle response regulator DivK